MISFSFTVISAFCHRDFASFSILWSKLSSVFEGKSIYPKIWFPFPAFSTNRQWQVSITSCSNKTSSSEMKFITCSYWNERWFMALLSWNFLLACVWEYKITKNNHKFIKIQCIKFDWQFWRNYSWWKNGYFKWVETKNAAYPAAFLQTNNKPSYKNYPATNRDLI